MRRTALALVAVLIASFALAACGSSGDSKPSTADYKKAWTPISQEIKNIGAQIGGAVTTAKGKTDAELAGTFGGLATETTSTATSLAKLDPPADVKADQTALVAALKVGAADLQAISDAATAGDPKKAGAATVKLVEDSGAIKKSRVSIDATVAKTS